MKKTLLLLLISFAQLIFGQITSTVSVFMYKNEKRVLLDLNKHSFVLNQNKKEFKLKLRIDTVDAGRNHKDQVGILEIPVLKVDSNDKVELKFVNSNYTIKADMIFFVKNNSLKIPNGTYLFFYYFSNYKKYKIFCSNHKCYSSGVEVTPENFSNWQLFSFHFGIERQYYFPIKISSVVKNKK